MEPGFSLGVIAKFNTINPEDWKKEMETIARLEIEHVEVLIDYPLGNGKTPSSLVQELAAWAERHGLGIIVHGPFAGKSLTDPHPGIRRIVIQEHLHTLEIAARLGARVYTLHAGLHRADTEQLPEYNPKRVLSQSLEPILEKARSHGIRVALENPKPASPPLKRYPENPTRVLEYIQEHPGLYMTLDTGHAILSGQDPIQILQKAIHRIADIHLHDSDGHQDHLCPGDGCLDLEKLLSTLLEKGYDGYLTIEVHNTPQGDGRRQATKKVRDTLQEILARDQTHKNTKKHER